MDDKKYVKLVYMLEKPDYKFEALELESILINYDDIFDAVEFEADIATLYCKQTFVLQEGVSRKEVEKHAKDVLFAILLEIVKKSGALGFDIDLNSCDESCIDVKIFYSSTKCPMTFNNLSNANIYWADGSILTEEENRQMLLESKKKNLEQIVLDSHSNMGVRQQDQHRFIRLFRIEDYVIRYCVLYSWLSELLAREDGKEYQADLDIFIENSNVYATIPERFKEPPFRTGRVQKDKTYFTYLRNLIGHTVQDTLDFDEADLIKEIKTCTGWLIQILLEKII